MNQHQLVSMSLTMHAQMIWILGIHRAHPPDSLRMSHYPNEVRQRPVRITPISSNRQDRVVTMPDPIVENHRNHQEWDL